MDTLLEISDDLKLPIELITETVAILAKRGVGKTYTASVVTEEILKVGGHVVAIDPVGVWWGLRAAADGEPEGGLQILIFGGAHADLPLDPTSGRAVADLIVAERLSCVLDLSLLSQEETANFLAPFLDRLYQINREPLHLMVDEADAVAPQVPGRHEGAMLSAMDRIVRRGRARGLGVTLITQRPAVLSKNVLTQIELLIAMRLTSPNDRKAIDGWIQAHGTENERKAVMGSLAKLEVGEAWFWSPAWLTMLERVRIRRRSTFDSSSTPKVGQMLSAPRSLASLDLSALRERFTSALTSAAETDPEQLRRRVDQLERALRERPVEVVVERHEVPVLREGEAERLEQAAENMTAMGKDLLAVAGEIKGVLAESRLTNKSANMKAPIVMSATVVSKQPHRSTSATSKQSAETDLLVAVSGEARLTSPQKRILDALASFSEAGLSSVARSNVAVWSGQSPVSSGFQNNLGRLRSQGIIKYPAPGFVSLSDVGKDYASVTTPIKNVEDLHQAWLSRLSRPQARIMGVLLADYPSPIDRLELARRSVQSANSSGYQNNLGSLRALGLINYSSPGKVVVTPLLFPSKLIR